MLYIGPYIPGADPGFFKGGGGGGSILGLQAKRGWGAGGGPIVGPMLKSLHSGPKRGGPDPPGSAHDTYI